MATHRASASLAPDLALPTTEEPAPLRAVHTPNFPALLRQYGASLVVTTYQAGKLVLVRDEGDSSSENSFTVPEAALADVSAALVERNLFRFPPASRVAPPLERNGKTE